MNQVQLRILSAWDLTWDYTTLNTFCTVQFVPKDSTALVRPPRTKTSFKSKTPRWNQKFELDLPHEISGDTAIKLTVLGIRQDTDHVIGTGHITVDGLYRRLAGSSTPAIRIVLELTAGLRAGKRSRSSSKATGKLELEFILKSGTVMEYLPPDDSFNALGALFRRADTEGRGLISPEQLRRAMIEHRSIVDHMDLPSTSALVAAVEDFEAVADRLLSFGELRDQVRFQQESRPALKSLESTQGAEALPFREQCLSRVFDEMDRWGTGHVTFSEVVFPLPTFISALLTLFSASRWRPSEPSWARTGLSSSSRMRATTLVTRTLQRKRSCLSAEDC